ncbi:MAG: hypothetical protein LUD84_06745 [Clostridiales bacterium]|nr:hypothetical protein [Clostridiales bacterium]
MAARKQVRYYKTFQDDFVESAGQDFTLRSDYVWIRDGRGARLLRAVLYAVGYVFAALYGKLFFHVKIVRDVDWKAYRDSGAVVYGNHTQPIGDK